MAKLNIKTVPPTGNELPDPATLETKVPEFMQKYKDAGINTIPVNGMNLPIDVEGIRAGIGKGYNFGDPSLANLYKSPLYNQGSFLSGLQQGRNYGSPVLKIAQDNGYFNQPQSTSAQNTPIQNVSNVQPAEQQTDTREPLNQTVEKKGFDFSKVGSFLNHPATRGAIMAGVVGLTGGSGLEALGYGMGTGSKYAANRQENKFNKMLAERYGFKDASNYTSDQVEKMAKARQFEVDTKSQALKDIKMEYEILSEKAKSPYYDETAKAEVMQKMATLEKTYQDIQTGKIELKYADKKARTDIRKTESDITYNETMRPIIENLKLRQGEQNLDLGNNKYSQDLREEFSKQSKSYIDVKDAYNRILAAANKIDPAGDLALIYGFMKLNDPGSVVREGEFATAQNSAGVPDIIRNQYNRVVRGERLAPDQRKQFIGRAGELYNAQAGSQRNLVKFYNNIAKQQGLTDNEITGLYDPDAQGNMYQAQPQATALVNVIAPDGRVRRIPQNQVQAALNAGGKLQ